LFVGFPLGHHLRVFALFAREIDACSRRGLVG